MAPASSFRRQPQQFPILRFQKPLLKPPPQNRFFQQPLFNPGQHDRPNRISLARLILPSPPHFARSPACLRLLVLLLEPPKPLLERDNPLVQLWHAPRLRSIANLIANIAPAIGKLTLNIERFCPDRAARAINRDRLRRDCVVVWRSCVRRLCWLDRPRRAEQKSLDREKECDRRNGADGACVLIPEATCHIHEHDHAQGHAWRAESSHRGALVITNPEAEPRQCPCSRDPNDQRPSHDRRCCHGLGDRAIAGFDRFPENRIPATMAAGAAGSAGCMPVRSHRSATGLSRGASEIREAGRRRECNPSVMLPE
jgi:hypothetical protein